MDKKFVDRGQSSLKKLGWSLYKNNDSDHPSIFDQVPYKKNGSIEEHWTSNDPSNPTLIIFEYDPKEKKCTSRIMNGESRHAVFSDKDLKAFATRMKYIEKKMETQYEIINDKVEETEDTYNILQVALHHPILDKLDIRIKEVKKSPDKINSKRKSKKTPIRAEDKTTPKNKAETEEEEARKEREKMIYGPKMGDLIEFVERRE